MTPVDMSTAPDAVFEARIAPFESAPVPEEVLLIGALGDALETELGSRGLNFEKGTAVAAWLLNYDAVAAALAVLRDQPDPRVARVLELAANFEALAKPPGVNEFDRGCASTLADAASAIRAVVCGTA